MKWLVYSCSTDFYHIFARLGLGPYTGQGIIHQSSQVGAPPHTPRVLLHLTSQGPARAQVKAIFLLYWLEICIQLLRLPFDLVLLCRYCRKSVRIDYQYWPIRCAE